MNQDQTDLVESLRDLLKVAMPEQLAEQVELINALREAIHEASPFAGEPVDLIRWVPADSVHSNDYNPNVVAPPEMELLALSILADGYTQPIVTNPDRAGDMRTVIDGFHRNRVGKEHAEVASRIRGYLPVVTINAGRTDRSDQIASTIRHNRARGKHQVTAMSDIVIELKRRNWSNDKIGRELGMDADEVLRLCQMTGLAELFADDDFSYSWDVDNLADSDDEALAEVAALIAGEAS
jgi:ParB-like chromosome segregation protein Spo0J